MVWVGPSVHNSTVVCSWAGLGKTFKGCAGSGIGRLLKTMPWPLKGKVCARSNEFDAMNQRLPSAFVLRVAATQRLVVFRKAGLMASSSARPMP